MKRFLFWFLVTLVTVAWYLSQASPPHRPGRVLVRHDRWARVNGPDGRPIGPVNHARAEVRNEFDVDDDGLGRPVRREPAEGLPVPVVPGSRVTEARIEPPAPPQPPRPPRPRRARPASRPATTPTPAPVNDSDLLTVTGQLSATEQRARNDARAQFERLLAGRLVPDVPIGWKVPRELVDGMIQEVVITPVERDYGTLYQATLKADVSPRARSEVVAAYHREEVLKRLAVLGALLGFVLACLAGVSGYIKADEATKGYYTNRLRLAAAGGVGAAGVLIYQWLA
jgi:hypothetical protein